MNREELLQAIEAFVPFNEQEEKDRIQIREWILNNENAFSRENAIAHMTASGWVVNRARNKVLMVYHNLYDSWSWLGGHADGETRMKPDENSGVGWFSPADALAASTEPWFVERIYKKLIEKVERV